MFQLLLCILLQLFHVSHQITTTETSATNKIVWFRDHGLRLQDNEALFRAMDECQPSSSIIPIYLWGKDFGNDASGGTASDLFIGHTLKSLDKKLDGALGQGFVKIEGVDHDCIPKHTSVDACIDAKASVFANELKAICEATCSSEVYYIRSSDRIFEEKLINRLNHKGIIAKDFSGCSLLDYSKEDVPWKEIILAHPFRSPLIPFVDFVSDRLSESPPSEIIDVPMEKLTPMMCQMNPSIFSNPVEIDSLLQRLGKSRGGTEWGNSIIESFSPDQDVMGELGSFLQSLGPKGLKKKTHFTSRLSPYLARGILSPRQVYQAIVSSGESQDKDSFVRRICWRDYTHAVVSLFPDVLYGRPIRAGYDDAYEDALEDEKIHALQMWKKGSTGIPIVDAGMRQLRLEGFMPQKVRLVCSTCLVEGLNIPWQYGMQHFKEYLVDHDVNININMWMNAGCVGLDPYYCGMKYRKRAYWDSNGAYVRKWCPELSNLPDSITLQQDGGITKKVDCLYEPWFTPKEVLEDIDFELGVDYPTRVCHDRLNREKFFDRLRKSRTGWPSGMMDDCKRDIVYLGRETSSERIGIFTPRALQSRSN